MEQFEMQRESAEMHDGADWSQRYGARCPICGVFTKGSYKRGPWKNGLKTRFHVCADPSCACRFKSIEEDTSQFMPPPTAEQLRFVRAVCEKPWPAGQYENTHNGYAPSSL